ncbi:MAG: hypothetical protein A2234_11065 [Elusimicrobia bacterium RIFOXYA2_FULL_58_8]|nr:MAG: hypothetical protein A2285_04485 [Elusimicrobia bacterium RIFOXYA12_FULL_57_11]OGS14430.1 MAG: hypothetical protein A2234_11065 [Elusimicrobia bacterium RIFOXYA2_FULL_58_8]
MLLLALPAALLGGVETRTLKGVAMPEQLSVQGVDLKLNGMGVRTKVVFKVYVAGLYLEKKSAAGLEIAAVEQVKRMELAFLRSVDGADVAGAISGGFEKNAGPAYKGLEERIKKFATLIPDVKKGDKLVFTYRPGAGLEVQANGKLTGEIEGKDFSDTLFKVWLGDAPADKALKAGLLGQ